MAKGVVDYVPKLLVGLDFEYFHGDQPAPAPPQATSQKPISIDDGDMVLCSSLGTDTVLK
jgi:hypothetical protein